MSIDDIRISPAIIPFSVSIFQKGNDQMTVEYGCVKGRDENGEARPIMCRVTGSHIPFPVFGGTWFHGIPKNQMINSMADLGYRLIAERNLPNGKFWVNPDQRELEEVVEDNLTKAMPHIARAARDAWKAKKMSTYTALRDLYQSVNPGSFVYFNDEQTETENIHELILSMLDKGCSLEKVTRVYAAFYDIPYDTAFEELAMTFFNKGSSRS